MSNSPLHSHGVRFTPSWKLIVLAATSLTAAICQIAVASRALFHDDDPLQGYFSFPSVEERVKYYMGSWYENSIDNSVCDRIEYFNETRRQYDVPYIYNRSNVDRALATATGYTKDVINRYLRGKYENANVIFSFGDQSPFCGCPLMAKAREVNQTNQPDAPTPIIGLLNVDRHFGEIENVKRLDIAWKYKANKLIWRGTSTGCGKRTRFVGNLLDSNRSEIDVGLTDLIQGEEKLIGSTDAERYKRPTMTLEEMLSYKYLLSLEGNDVSTGLKWMLYSNSVVFMPIPTHVTWAMEDKLVPFYHYIPVEADGSDAEKAYRWALEHDTECRLMAKRATQYMKELFSSRTAVWTNQVIVTKIMERYERQYGKVLAACTTPRTRNNLVRWVKTHC